MHCGIDWNLRICDWLYGSDAMPSRLIFLSPRLYRMHTCTTGRIRRHRWSNGGNTVSGRHFFKRCRLFFMYAVSHGLLLPIQRIRRCYIVPSW